MGVLRDWSAVARRALMVIVSAQFVVMVVTGIWLVFYYRPDASAAYFAVQRARYAGWSPVFRSAHRVVAFSMIPTTIGMAGFLSAEFRGRKRHERRWSPAVAAGVVLAVLVLGAAITGYRLPWGSVALWAVKVPTHVAGYRFVFGPAARFVLMGRTEVSKPTLWRWFVVHTVVLPLLVLGALTILWRTRRGRPTPLPGGDSLDAPVQPGR